MPKILLVIFVLCSCTAIAQSGRLQREFRGSVIVNKDPRLDVLASKQAEINRKAEKRSRSGYYPGFRIQVVNTQNRDEANIVKTEMLRRFPDQKVYFLYQAPNFKVRIGNFFTQKEGSALRKMIAALYPDRGIFFVADRIEYIEPEEEEETKDK
jgi:hypothetical protein